jgi:hypothetical protein
MRQAVYRGIRRVDQHFKLVITASNIVRTARSMSADRKEPRNEQPEVL